MMLDPATLTEQGLKDGIAAFGQMSNFLAVRLRDAEGRLAGADQDVTEFRKLVALVRDLSDEYRVRLHIVQSEQTRPTPRPDG